jgi:hypothetical protein
MMQQSTVALLKRMAAANFQIAFCALNINPIFKEKNAIEKTES